jgi:PRTRC genetic system protein A
VRGLTPLGPVCELVHGRLPAEFWVAMVHVARVSALSHREVLLTVDYEPGQGYRLWAPPQVGGPTQVLYQPAERVVLEVHSHRAWPARFSRTDDRDEQRLRLYGVIGRLDQPVPEVALRAGAYGMFLPVPWAAVFEGDPTRVRDRHATTLATEEGEDDALSD